MKTAIIIQARTDSKRFPKKVLQLIQNKSILEHVIERCKHSGLPIIVATTKRKIDNPISIISKNSSVECFRGSTNDVLDRFYQASLFFGITNIIRITADCPLIDPVIIKKIFDIYTLSNFDVVRTDEKTFPDGLDVEIFSFSTLEKTWKEAKLQSEREHVTPFMYKKNFRTKEIKNDVNLGSLRWTVDYIDDLDFVRKIYEKFSHSKLFLMNDILKIIQNNPNLKVINNHHSRNEGYQISIKND